MYLRGRRPTRLDKEGGVRVGVSHTTCTLLPGGKAGRAGAPSGWAVFVQLKAACAFEHLGSDFP